MKTTGTQPDIEILYEDNHLLVINKPAGLLSQEDFSGSPDVLTLCKKYLKKEYNKPGNVFLGLLHRLDKPVSGVMMLAKTSKAASRISKQIRNREIDKTYLAVVEGETPKNGFLNHHLIKDEKNNIVNVVSKNMKGSKESSLTYQALAYNKGLSVVKIHLITGRAHQIRVQFAEESYPIWGDKKYGNDKSQGIALHAYQLNLEHPTLKNELKVQAYPPLSPPWNAFENLKIL